MRTAHSFLYAALGRQLIVQVILAVVVAALFGWFKGSAAAYAAFFGGGITATNTLILRWHMWRAQRMGAQSAGKNIRLLYRAALERFVATVVLFALGLGLLHLTPLPLLLGFLAGLLALPTTGFQK